jgi:hypothetical protein
MKKTQLDDDMWHHEFENDYAMWWCRMQRMLTCGHNCTTYILTCGFDHQI